MMYEKNNLGASGHSAECKECAYEITSTSHTLEYITLGDTYHTQRCKYCNYVGARQQHILQLTGGVGNYKKCQICGAMVPVSGGGGIFPVEPTKKEDDPEEETEKF